VTRTVRDPGHRRIPLLREGGALLAVALCLVASSTHGAELTPAAADTAIDSLSPVSTASADRATSNGAIALSDVEPGRAAGEGRLVGAVVHLHIVDDGLRKSIGGQSGRMVVDMDCRSGWFRSRDMTVWSGPYESGEARPLRASADWTAAGGGAYLTQLTRSVCAQAGLAAESSAPPPAVAVAETAPPPPDPSPPAPVRPAAAAAGAYHVQFVASHSEQAVKALVARAAPRLAAELGELDLSVQRAVVAGQVFYRGRIGAFADADAARRFCATLAPLGLPCLLTHE